MYLNWKMVKRALGMGTYIVCCTTKDMFKLPARMLSVL